MFQRADYQRYKRCRALYDCEADNEDELTFEEGDVIIILAEETEDDNWMEGVLETVPEKRGLFPASFVHMLTDWPLLLMREMEWNLMKRPKGRPTVSSCDQYCEVENRICFPPSREQFYEVPHYVIVLMHEVN